MTRSETMRRVWAERRSALVEEVEMIWTPSQSPVEVAARLGYDNPLSLARRLHRAGRRDLARRFDTRKLQRAYSHRGRDA